MKIFILTVLSLLTYLCNTKSLPFLPEFQESLNTWKKLDPATYTYSSSFNSWTGYGQSTEVKVSQHKVVQRKFESWEQYITPTSLTRTLDSWVEDTQENIGTHKQGFPAETMEQIYQRCLDEVLTKNTEDTDIFFDVDSKGVLKQCQYYPHFCSDDCMFGILLDAVNFGSEVEL